MQKIDPDPSVEDLTEKLREKVEEFPVVIVEENPKRVEEKKKPSKKENKKNNYNQRIPSKVEENDIGENIMPKKDEANELTSSEVQPSDPITPNSLGQLANSGTSDPTLTLLLALLAVVGGGAAWKFYTQYSEQKHEQKMKQLEMDAKAKGLGGAQPPPCQAANVKLEAEIKAINGRLDKVDQKMSLNADFDADLLERKVKKMDRRLKDLEEKE